MTIIDDDDDDNDECRRYESTKAQIQGHISRTGYELLHLCMDEMSDTRIYLPCYRPACCRCCVEVCACLDRHQIKGFNISISASTKQQR